jgi:hypothetical protein
MRKKVCNEEKGGHTKKKERKSIIGLFSLVKILYSTPFMVGAESRRLVVEEANKTLTSGRCRLCRL